MIGILRVLKGERLPCGCLIGTYERYDGSIVWVLDARAPECPRPEHRVGTSSTSNTFGRPEASQKRAL